METKAQRECVAQITRLLWIRAIVHTQVLLTPKSEQLSTKLYSGLCNLLQTKTFSLVKCKLLESICKIAHWESIWLFCKITNVVISVPWCLWVQLKEKCLFMYMLFAVRTKAQYVFTWVFTAKKLGQVVAKLAQWTYLMCSVLLSVYSAYDYIYVNIRYLWSLLCLGGYDHTWDAKQRGEHDWNFLRELTVE